MLELEGREIIKSQTKISQEKDEEKNTDNESYINLLSSLLPINGIAKQF